MMNQGGATLTVLVVEDDVFLAELIRQVLNDVRGWGATVVHDARAARLVIQYVDIDVLITDVNLPGISGLALVKRLRQASTWRKPPVLLMSADPNQAAIQEALHDHLVDRFIRKPFDVDQLVRELRATIEEGGVSSPLADSSQPM
ncbi:MAG: response regulator [Chloroflexota bacterium]